MKQKNLIVLVALALVFVFVLVIGISMIAGYNDTVKMEETISANKAQVENRLLQRHDKIGLLVPAVEGLQEYALNVYQMITDARTAYANATTQEELIAADALESAALTSLLVVIEDNPNLTPSAAYYAYIDEVSAMENSLTVARRDYNESVREYNTKVKKFPRVLYINMFGFEKQYDYWELPNGAGEVPIVDFTD